MIMSSHGMSRPAFNYFPYTSHVLMIYLRMSVLVHKKLDLIELVLDIYF